MRSRVFVVDDDPAIRESLCFLVSSVGLDVEAFANGREFLDRYDAERPGCLVLDVRMPDVSGLELQDELGKRGVRVPIVMITGFGDVPMAVRALKNGALDFIEKPFTDQDLLDRIHEALNVDRRWRQQRERERDVEARIARLTVRERQVMESVVAGKPNKAIADELGLSPKTIEVHRSRMMEKMRVGSLAALLHLVVGTPRART